MKTLTQFQERLLFVGARRQGRIAQTQGVDLVEKSERVRTRISKHLYLLSSGQTEEMAEKGRTKPRKDNWQGRVRVARGPILSQPSPFPPLGLF
jgi:hypothetical protein